MAYPLFLVATLLLVELLGSLILACYDFIRFAIPKRVGWGLLALILLLQAGIIFYTGLTGIALMILGALFWLVIGGVAKGRLISPYQGYAPFDKIALFISAITFPILFLISMLIYQGICALLVYIRKMKLELPVLTIYCASFFLAVVVIASTVGLTVAYL